MKYQTALFSIVFFCLSTLIGGCSQKINQNELNTSSSTQEKIKGEISTPIASEDSSLTNVNALKFDGTTKESIPQRFTGFSDVSAFCDEKISRGALEIEAICSEDLDKDGYPDSPRTEIIFTNTSESEATLVFKGVLNLPGLLSKPPHNFEHPWFSDLGTSMLVWSKVAIQPNKTFKLNAKSKTDGIYTYPLGIGEVEVDYSESQEIEYECPKRGIAEDRIFGVYLKASCGGLTIENNAADSRSVMVKPNYPNIEMEYLALDMRSYSGAYYLDYFREGSAEIQVLIP